MATAFHKLVEHFNAQKRDTPDGKSMQVRTQVLAPEEMVREALGSPTFQALTPDSSLWLSQLDEEWAEQQVTEVDDEADEVQLPIGSRLISSQVRYATSPIVIVAWESVARQLGWPERAIGWQDVQRQATSDPNFKWNHPSTSHGSGLLATLAEFYAGAGLTRGLTEEAAIDPQTIEYVRSVEATVRFYGEGEEVVVERLAAEGRDFLDAFVAQERVVIEWNQAGQGERSVAIYPAEGTLWADHPLALLELGGPDETAVTDNQRRTFQAFADFLTSAESQREFLAAGYRPADLSIALDEAGSPFANTDAVDWRQPQTTLQIPGPAVVEVVRDVWLYTKRPTNVFLVVDTSGSMQGTKLGRTKEALAAFVEQVRGNRDQVGLVEFGTGIKTFATLRSTGERERQDLITLVGDLEASGDTALIDAVVEAFVNLQAAADQEAINAIVVMTDGQENHSRNDMGDLRRFFEREQKVPVVVFTIAFGDDADEHLLKEMADIGSGQFRRAGETDIEELYKIISTYF
jgi:Ca-activated chloride channel family protein